MTTDSNHSDQRKSEEAGAQPAGEETAAGEPGGPARQPAPAPPGRGGAERPAPPPRARGGRLLASLALLLALAAAGGAGYLYYELIYTAEADEADDVAGEVDALEASIERVNGRLQELGERQQAALEQLREREAAARAETEQALRESLSEVARQAPPSTAEWRRAEVRYLLRIANHRLLMERDVEGALRLLRTADSVLAELDDFALHDVRARLADEIAALEGLEHADVQGLFLRLEAAKRNLDELPLRLPEYTKPEPEPESEAPPGDGGFWSTLQRELSGLIELRRLDADVKPLLEPDEAAYLELNLRLMLERAQLAAVRRDQLVYEESLATAIEWIHQYLDTGKGPVQRLLDELNELQTVDLAEPLPDISGSLNALRRALEGPA